MWYFGTKTSYLYVQGVFFIYCKRTTAPIGMKFGEKHVSTCRQIISKKYACKCCRKIFTYDFQKLKKTSLVEKGHFGGFSVAVPDRRIVERFHEMKIIRGSSQTTYQKIMHIVIQGRILCTYNFLKFQLHQATDRIDL